MQTITLILANTLLLLIVVIGVCVERRVARLELARSREAANARELRREVERIKTRAVDSGESESEARRVKDAERRFTEGVASILSYGLRAAGKETEHVEDAGA